MSYVIVGEFAPGYKTWKFRICFFVKACGEELTGLQNIFLITFTGTMIKSTKMWKTLDGRDFSGQFSSLPYQTWLKICWLYMGPTNSFKYLGKISEKLFT